ncbi:hypothetical protein, partial [Streptomyces sp. NPDC004976]
MDLRMPGSRWLRSRRPLSSPPPSRRPRRVIAAAAAVVVLAGAGTWSAVASDDAPAVRRADRVVNTGGGVRIDTS